MILSTLDNTIWSTIGYKQTGFDAILNIWSEPNDDGYYHNVYVGEDWNII